MDDHDHDREDGRLDESFRRLRLEREARSGIHGGDRRIGLRIRDGQEEPSGEAGGRWRTGLRRQRRGRCDPVGEMEDIDRRRAEEHRRHARDREQHRNDARCDRDQDG